MVYQSETSKSKKTQVGTGLFGGVCLDVTALVQMNNLLLAVSIGEGAARHKREGQLFFLSSIFPQDGPILVVNGVISYTVTPINGMAL